MTSSDENADFGACSPWPAGFEDQLDEFRQGHIVDDVPVFFLESAVPLWSRPREQLGASNGGRIVGEHGQSLRRAMILTQACDLMKPQNPWITVCPVYDASTRLSTGKAGQVKAGQILQMVHVTADWAADGFWVADLRLEIPVEKSMLANRQPIEAFQSPDDYDVLAMRLGARRSRPATPQSCLDLVATPLFEAMHELSDGGESLNRGLRELRIGWNDPSRPTVVHVYVMARSESERLDVDVAGWQQLVSVIYESAAEAGMTVVGPEITTLDDMSAAEYLTSASIEDTLSS